MPQSSNPAIHELLRFVFWLVTFFFTKPSKGSLDKLLYKGLLKNIKRHVTEKIFGATFRDYYFLSFYRKTYATSSKDIIYIGLFGIWINLTEFIISTSGFICFIFLLLLILFLILEKGSVYTISKQYTNTIIFSLLLYLSFVPTLENLIGTDYFNTMMMESFILLLMSIQTYMYTQQMTINRVTLLLILLRGLACSCLFHLVYYSIPTRSTSLPLTTDKTTTTLTQRFANNFVNIVLNIKNQNLSFYWFEYSIDYREIGFILFIVLLLLKDWFTVLGCLIGYILMIDMNDYVNLDASATMNHMSKNIKDFLS